MRSTFGVDGVKDPLLLFSRLLMMLLFIIFGWQKLVGYGGTVAYFAHLGVPLPTIATFIAVVMELGVGIALAMGLFTRPLAILLGLYTLVTGIVGHPFWNMAGADRLEAEINFFKNVSIMAGLFLSVHSRRRTFLPGQQIGSGLVTGTCRLREVWTLEQRRPQRPFRAAASTARSKSSYVSACGPTSVRRRSP
jgi:putative oxidoreductase